MKLNFGEWLPDLPALANPGSTIAKNCIPRGKSFGQLRDLQAFTTALTGVCLGGIWARASSGTIYNFAGDATKLYKLASGSWANVSKALNYSGVENWEFVMWGDRIIAVDVNTPTQYYDMGTSALFADLTGSPPQAKRIGIVGDFIVMGNLTESSVDYPNRIRWGGYNSSTIWTPSMATQSDKQDLYGRGGKVQKIVPGQTGFIFQEHTIRRMVYEGPPRIFRIDSLEEETGTPAGNSVCWTRGKAFYLGHDGFNIFDGQASTQIGAERLDRWFHSNADSSALEDVRGVVDRINRLVLFGFKSSSSLAYCDKLAIYNWVADKWTYGDVNTECLIELVGESTTLDGLDAVYPLGIDAQTFSVDSPAFQGGALALTAFNSSHQGATFDGSPLTAVLETSEYCDDSRQMTHIKSVRPLVDGSAASVQIQVGTRSTQQENYSWGASCSVNNLGEANPRSKARFQRIRASISGGFTDAQGVDIDARPAGRK